MSFIRKADATFPASVIGSRDASLRNRGSLTIWFTPEAIAGWKAQPRTTPGGQRHYSDLAIETALTLRTVFRLALRQSEGLIGSIMKMLEIDLPVPDHTTLALQFLNLALHGRDLLFFFQYFEFQSLLSFLFGLVPNRC